jgi:hypothetical protein
MPYASAENSDWGVGCIGSRSPSSSYSYYGDVETAVAMAEYQLFLKLFKNLTQKTSHP